jgi:hypothetical protein
MVQKYLTTEKSNAESTWKKGEEERGEEERGEEERGEEERGEERYDVSKVKSLTNKRMISRKKDRIAGCE